MRMQPSKINKFEFHISRNSRDTYQFDEALFSIHGNVIIANFLAAREFAQRMNARRDLATHPELAVRASDINAMGLIDEILHALIEYYRKEINPAALGLALSSLQSSFGEKAITTVLETFLDEFPPLRVYRNETTAEEYLQGMTDGDSNQLIALEELILLWVANTNPAFQPYNELFDDTRLVDHTVYPQIFPILQEFFETQPKLESLNLLDALQEPARRNPKSLSAQLEFLMRRWQKYIGSHFLLRILGSLDFIKEESKIVFGTGGGGGTTDVYEFDLATFEPEMFSPDRDWMPSLVLLAKNTYVWLDQLSKMYGRQISRLDQVPNEELDRMRAMGFTGLWMIGLWERSNASQRIKQLCGNPEAVASAYSLYDYQIAGDLGGDEAYAQLKARAWQRGIRLAADMVPNHVGVYSKWVIEHPDWFVSLNYSPFPNYTFNGPDLSEDGRVGIFIEDHYYSKNDAAVVFKRVDRWTGDEKFIYHGNDGTSMPWNDTAQLNYLLPEVREAVIQTILAVARKFPVIRFDAAMTLAKKHYQRLWFPEPGSGGDIPTRAEFGLTKEQFDAAMPEEFWREVVDRVAAEVPDTLLLAEAFWLMEGYFVRTLGMHRVYNSAFMNMLRDEKNAEYRLVIKNTIEFDPEILKRYVNFMNNPDERTAVDQFGKGDKYFGTAAMMATLPGLPMFGHGQIEGFTEKYGMEYRRAYWDESPDSYLVQRHEREIAPLLHKRYVFANVDQFLLYDFYTQEGYVNEDVFAYSNQAFGERGLFIYHNRFADTRGWIHISAAYAIKSADGEEKYLTQKTLAQGLQIDPAPGKFTIFRDRRTGLEYIRSSSAIAEKGLYFELGAYDYHIFTDFREVQDDEWQHYRQLADSLAGNGVPSVDEALRELFLQAIHVPFREIVNPGQFEWIVKNMGLDPISEADAQLLEQTQAEIETKSRTLYAAVLDYTNGTGDIQPIVKNIVAEVQTLQVVFGADISNAVKPTSRRKALEFVNTGLQKNDFPGAGTLLAWMIVHHLGEVQPGSKKYTAQEADEVSSDWLDEWLLKKIVRETLRGMGYDDNQAWRSVALLSILVKRSTWYEFSKRPKNPARQLLESFLIDEEIRNFLGVNRYQETLWFNQDAMESLLWGLMAIATLDSLAEESQAEEPKEINSKKLNQAWKWVNQINIAVEDSAFQVDKLLEAL